MTCVNLFVAVVFVIFAPSTTAAQWPDPKAPVIPGADGYIDIPHAAIAPKTNHVYKAIFDATAAASEPTQLVPAINMAGSELNAFGVGNVPLENVKFAIVFHGNGMGGIFDDAHYNEKFGVNNPNLKTLAAMKKIGVELYVCGQNLSAENIDPATISPDVTVASDALIVLMEYQNKGYALMSF